MILIFLVYKVYKSIESTNYQACNFNEPVEWAGCKCVMIISSLLDLIQNVCFALPFLFTWCSVDAMRAYTCVVQHPLHVRLNHANCRISVHTQVQWLFGTVCTCIHHESTCVCELLYFKFTSMLNGGADVSCGTDNKHLLRLTKLKKKNQNVCGGTLFS